MQRKGAGQHNRDKSTYIRGSSVDLLTRQSPVALDRGSIWSLSTRGRRVTGQAGEATNSIERSGTVPKAVVRRWSRVGFCMIPLCCALVRSAAGQADFDLVSDQQDANGLMQNPHWAAQADPKTLDPQRTCGILALHGAAGYRALLLRNPDCFGPEQRCILRLNEPRGPVVAGAACSQAANDGSPHGHLNWFPVTMTGTLRFNGSLLGKGGDHDLTFEFLPDPDDGYAPATKWNERQTLRHCTGNDTQTYPTIHIEFDYRETTHRLEGGVGDSWWHEFRKLSDTAKSKHARQNVDRMLGPGRGTVTGLFNLDLIHYGHSEIHPVYAMAVLVKEKEDIDNSELHQRWVLLARDRGNEGNCAAPGAIPFRLGTKGDVTYRFRLDTPRGVKGPPSVLKAKSWVGVSTTTVAGPTFHWAPNQGLEVHVGWPHPDPSKPDDALILADTWITWRRDVAADRSDVVECPPHRPLMSEGAIEAEGTKAEEAYYKDLARITKREDWSPQVHQAPSLPDGPKIAPASAEIFDREAPVVDCSQVKLIENPRCRGDASLSLLSGFQLPDAKSFVVGLSWENARFYIGGPVARFRIAGEYQRQRPANRLSGEQVRHTAAIQPTLVIGPVRKLATSHLIVSAGVGRDWGEHSAWFFPWSMGRVGIGVPLRTGYRVGVDLEALLAFRRGDKHHVLVQFRTSFVGLGSRP